MLAIVPEDAADVVELVGERDAKDLGLGVGVGEMGDVALLARPPVGVAAFVRAALDDGDDVLAERRDQLLSQPGAVTVLDRVVQQRRDRLVL